MANSQPPAKSQWASAEDAEDVVAAVLGAVEAGVGALPAAVDGVGAIGFGQNVLKGHLKLTRDMSQCV